MTEPSRVERVKPFAFAALGSVVGLLGALALGNYRSIRRSDPAATPVASRHPSNPTTEPPESRAPDHRPLLRSLEARLSALEQRTLDAGPAQGPAGSLEQARLSERSNAERALREYDAFRAELRNHAEEPRDPQWASETDRLFTNDFRITEATLQYRSVQVDCRMTTCVASVEWPSFPEARRRVGLLLTQPLSRNCARSVSLLPPDQPAAPYRAQLLIDCTDLRGGAQ